MSEPCREDKQQWELQDVHCSSTGRPNTHSHHPRAHCCLPSHSCTCTRIHTFTQDHSLAHNLCLFWAALWSAHMQGGRKERKALQQEEEEELGRQEAAAAAAAAAAAQEFCQVRPSWAEHGRVTEHPETGRWIPLVQNWPVQTVEVLAWRSDGLAQGWAS